MREKMFINVIGNIRKIGNMGNVRSLKLENVKDVDWIKRESIVGGGGGGYVKIRKGILWNK